MFLFKKRDVPYVLPLDHIVLNAVVLPHGALLLDDGQGVAGPDGVDPAHAASPRVDVRHENSDVGSAS